MRVCWIVSILSTVVSMGLLMVNTGQYQMLAILNTRNEKLQKQSEKLYNQFLDEEIFKVTVENLVTQGKKVMKNLEDTVAKLNSEMEKKKTENDACQAEKVKHFSFLSFSVGLSICHSLMLFSPHSICKYFSCCYREQATLTAQHLTH